MNTFDQTAQEIITRGKETCDKLVETCLAKDFEEITNDVENKVLI